MSFKKHSLLMATIFTIALGGCKKWDDHIAINNPDLTQDLYRAIVNNPNLSKFAEFVSKTGLDSLLKSSKTYTVWAPSNDAMASLDPSLPSDVVRLKSFLLNHISNQLYFTKDATTSLRIAMLNGKYNNFKGTKFDDATITTADKYYKNGVLHVVDKILPVLPNLWDYVNSTTAQYLQNSFVAGLNFSSFDPTLAIVDSISSSTGLPVYRPGTGIVIKNSFNEKVFDLRREDKQYTYFIIANAGFTLKADSLKNYFNTGNAARTDSLDKWNVVKDLVVDTLYPTAATIPNVLLSKFGIAVPVNKALIIDTKKLSNGMAYTLSLSDVPTYTKFLPRTIQGENPTGFLSDKTGNTNYRVRSDRPDSTKFFNDIMISGHGVTDYYVYYRLNEMPSMKYNVYARAINDIQTQAVYESIMPVYFVPPATFTQIAAAPAFSPTAPRSPAQLWYPVPGVKGGVSPLPAIYTFNAPSFAAVASTAAAAYSELFLGSFTSTSFGTLDIRVMSGATATLPTLPVFGNTGTGPIILDYVRLVPVP